MSSIPTVIIKVDTIAELTNFVNSKPVMYCLENQKIYGWNGSVPEILTVSSAGFSGGQPSNTNLAYSYWEDDFIQSPNPLPEANSQEGWINVNIGINFTGSVAEVDHPGVLKITGAPNSSWRALAFLTRGTGNGVIAPANLDEMNWVIKLGGVIGNVSFNFGLSDGFGMLAVNNGVYIQKLAADTNWFGVCRNGGTETRVSLASFELNKWTRLRLRRDPATGNFIFNVGKDGADSADQTISTNKPTAVSMIQGEFYDSASSAVFLLDYFNVSTKNVRY